MFQVDLTQLVVIVVEFHQQYFQSFFLKKKEKNVSIKLISDSNKKKIEFKNIQFLL